MMERWPKYLLRLNLNANRSGDVSLRSRLNNREQPPFVLNGRPQTENLRRPVVALRANICQSASSRNKLLTDFLMAIIDLQPTAGSKPVVRPSLCSLALSTDPTRKTFAGDAQDPEQKKRLKELAKNPLFPAELKNLS